MPLEALRFRRVLFGAFPTYASSPLRPHFDRILQARCHFLFDKDLVTTQAILRPTFLSLPRLLATFPHTPSLVCVSASLHILTHCLSDSNRTLLLVFQTAQPGRQVGDASASQSPLSFGGFGTMLRHLPRLAAGVDSALRADALSQRALAVLQARTHRVLPIPCPYALLRVSWDACVDMLWVGPIH